MKFENIIELLEEYDIEYWDAGSKNVSPGWIGIQCPFPDCDDDSNHLGIRLKDNKVNCWKCGPHSLRELLELLTDLKSKEISEAIKFLGAVDDPPLHRTPDAAIISELRRKMSLPQEFTSRFPETHIKYLRNRGFPPLKTIRKYKLRATQNLGKYKFCIVIPVYMNNKLVNFTTRDVTGEREAKYKMARTDEVIKPREYCVYNIDSVIEGGDCFLCEGPFDVMKMGDGAVSFFGVQESAYQIIELKNKKIKNLYVMYDNDKAGNKNANRVAKMFAPLFKKVEVIRLEGIKDPGALTLEEVEIIKSNLRFNLR